MRLIFVYGSLMRGQPNHHYMDGATYLGDGITLPEYAMVSMGGFPAVYANGDTAIMGEVYQVPDKVLDRMDRLEGHPIWYKRTPIKLVNRSKAEMYIMQSNNRERYSPIESGNWKEYCG